MKKKLKLYIGEELYEIGPALLTGVVVVVGLILIITKNFPVFNFDLASIDFSFQGFVSNLLNPHIPSPSL
jgi:hypothetical protein